MNAKGVWEPWPSASDAPAGLLRPGAAVLGICHEGELGAVLRRCYREESAPAGELVRLAACELDFDRAQVIRNGERIPLTATEFKLLRALCRSAGKIVTIDLLCEAVWGDNPYGYENSLMAHIRRVREKIEANPSKPVSLITVKGLGYKLITEGIK